MLYRNKKKGTLYKLIGTAINCTNAQDGQIMLIYEPYEQEEEHLVFVRERNEFYEKFELVDKIV
jgi:hypothetical protein